MAHTLLDSHFCVRALDLLPRPSQEDSQEDAERKRPPEAPDTSAHCHARLVRFAPPFSSITFPPTPHTYFDLLQNEHLVMVL